MMRAGFYRRFGLAAALIPAVVSACGSQTNPLNGEAGISTVYILAVDQLTPPEVAQADVYIPAFIFELDPDDALAGWSTGFFVTVASSSAENLKIRLRNRQSGITTSLQRVSPPAEQQTLRADAAWNLEPTIREALQSGTGVYWLLESETPEQELAHQLAIAIPESRLTSFATLEIYSLVSPDGTPLGADRIELVQDFFYMAALGDSAMWGNGLREQDKFTTLVAREIENQTGRKVIRQVYAVSGARIVPHEEDGSCVGKCYGEVPKAFPSITAQVEFIEHPESMDLILLDGCANDVGLSKLLDPESSPQEIEFFTRDFCKREMINLLRLIRESIPQAPIVVTGYFPIISSDSDFSKVEQWVLAQANALFTIDELIELVGILAANSAVFHETSRDSITAAVELLNAMTPGLPMIAFVDPGFGPQNAAFASEPWLWGLKGNDELAEVLELEHSLELFPEDPLLDYRFSICLEPGVRQDFVTCIYTSVGHPNPSGARAYADGIVEALPELGVLPTQPISE